MEVGMTSEHSTRKHNLPAPASSFIGREQELREIRQRLTEHRLLTLTGAGGTGKTRLALQAATAERERFADGVWLVELAPLSRPELVGETLATVLAVPETAEPPLEERLCAALSAKHLLLVLDNCEHLLEACSRLVALLLANSPNLRMLVTSREPLGISGEVVVRVPSLRLPDSFEPLDQERLLSYDALHLFVERAQAAEPSFRFTAVTAGAVVEICRRLDGIPLALELAAVRVRGLGVAYLAARLDQRFQLLTAGDRTALPRQQTLEATIEWSERLLPEAERVLLRRLGVFVGGFALEAAEQVCAGAYSGHQGQGTLTPQTILPHLLALVNKSLLHYDQDAGRYRLLETIRLFALARLAEASETASVRRQHFAWYLQQAEDGAALLGGPGQQAWFTRLEQEHDNFRTALGWAIDEDRADEAARLALGLWRFWHMRTYQREGLRWLERILALDAVAPLPPALRPRLLNALGVLCHSLRQFDRATSYHSEALRLWRALDDREGQAQALLDISWQQFDEMKVDQARKSAREGLALARVVGDRQAEARALLLGAAVAVESDLVEEAIPALEESLVFFRERGDTANMAFAMAALARAEGIRGNDERVKPLLREAVGLFVQLGNFINLVSPLVALGFMAMHAEVQPEGARSAAQVFGMLATWSEKLGGTSPWAEGPLQQTIEQLTAMLGADAFAQAFEIGEQMTPADLVRLAEQITAPTQETILPTPPSPTPVHSRLSPREMEVLHLVAKGLTNAQVAEALTVTPRTVNAHLTAIYGKLGVTSRAGAIRYALEQQLG
jgi:predicted ATPase/DNA-binding CsgD family transcriptional regulator